MADKKNGTQGAGQAVASAPTASVGTAGAGRKKITKVEAVRRAMLALGEEASRADIQGYVRQKFGLPIGLDHISNCKGELAKRAAPANPKAAPTAKPAAAKKPAAQLTPARTPQARTAGGNGSAGDAVSLQDVLLTKELLDRVGAGPLKVLINGLAK